MARRGGNLKAEDHESPAATPDGRLERLLDLTATLLDSARPLTRGELLSRVPGYPEEKESARRQLARDIALLRDQGFPIEVTERDADPDTRFVYSLERSGYHLPDLGLTEDESAALQLAVAAIGAGPPGAAKRAVHKLGGVEARLVAPEATADVEVPEAVIALFGALGERRQVRCAYNGEVRTLDPWGLSSAKGRWYLRAFDHHRGEPRTYRVDRIDGLVETIGATQAYVVPTSGATGSPPPPWLLGDDVEMVAEVEVDAGVAEQAVLMAGTGALARRHEDGAVTLRLPVTNRDALRSFVLGFLDAAEVVGPPELRADMVAWVVSVTASLDRP